MTKTLTSNDSRFDFYTRAQSQDNLAKLARQKPRDYEYLVIQSDRILDEWVDKIESLSTLVALDTETNGLKPVKGALKTLQLAWDKQEPVLIIRLPKIKNRASLSRLLGNPKILKAGHNLKFDIEMLAAEGIEIKGPVACTMVGLTILNSGATRQASLQFAALSLLDVVLDKAEQNSDWSSAYLNPQQLQYAANDAGILVDLLVELQRQLEDAGLLELALLEYCCILPIARMQRLGICLDKNKWVKVKRDYELQRDKLADAVKQELGEFNIASSKQLLKALNEIGLELSSTNSNVLIEWVKDYPVIDKIIEYRSTNTIINTFLKGFEGQIDDRSRIRGNWWQIGTRTGRTSCNVPNLSNIPKTPKIRNCFRAKQGYVLVDADYSQMELRLAATRMRVPTLIEAFQEGMDIHALTASYIYDCKTTELSQKQRRLGKVLNLGLIYGMGAEKFRLNAAKKFGVYLDPERAKELRKLFFEFYPEIAEYHFSCRRAWQIGRNRACSTLGRLNIWSSKPKLNQIINYPIQADCADILKRAVASWEMHLLYHNLDAQIVLMAYDQLVIETLEGLGEAVACALKRVMIEAGKDVLDPVPLVVDVKVDKFWS